MLLVIIPFFVFCIFLYRKEILEDMPELDVLLVSVGGGGLISGIAAYVKAVKPSVKVTRGYLTCCVIQ